MEWVLVGFVVLWLFGMVLCVISDKKAYNNGICPECFEKLRHFDTDSQGGRGYVCDKCHYVTWIGWPVDQKEK